MRIEFTLPTIVLVMALGFPLTLKAEDTQVLPFSSPEIYNLIKPELTTRDVWFEDLGENRIRVKTTDINLIFQIADEAVLKILPKNRSASLEKSIHAEVVSRLESEQIPFIIRCFDNSLWLVWEAQYTDRIKMVISETAKEVAPSSTNKFAKCA